MNTQLTIAALSAKGGASKTTLLMSLAGTADKSVTVTDCDASESSRRWADALGIPTKTARSARMLRQQHASTTTPYVLIDTPPLYEDESLVRTAIQLADIVLIPLNPSPADIDRLPLVTNLLPGKDWAIVVTQERPYTRLGKVLRADLAEAELPTLTTGMPFREDTRTSWGERVPDPKHGLSLWIDLSTIGR